MLPILRSLVPWDIAGLIDGWPRWRKNIRSDSRKRGFDFLAAWIPAHRPELLRDR
jgi:hypothetical protein